MITRSLLLIDRIATLVLAVVLIAGGALGVWWWTNTGPLPQNSDTRSVQAVVNHDWFPWASAVAGAVLVLVALRWMAAHLRRNDVKELNLRGSSSHGVLIVNAAKVAAAAADAFTDMLGVASATGTVTRDRGQLVAKISATVDPDIDLTAIAEHADQVAVQIRHVLGRDDVRCRFELRTAGLAQRLPGVS